MSLPKVTYFNGPGRAEPIRLAFYIGGIQFEDERIGFPEFGKRKASLVAGQLPVLTLENGEQIGQSDGILRYAGRMANLYPETNPLAAARVDEMLDALAEVTEPLMKTFAMGEDEKKASREKTVKEVFPKKFDAIEKIRGKNAYIATDGFTIADIMFYTQVNGLPHLDYIGDNILEGRAELQALYDKIAAHPKILEWSKRNSSKTYKLTYFDIGGRAEPIRNAFKIAKIDFEDERITGPQFKEMKDSLPGGQVPILTLEDGSVLTQSYAILRFVGSLPSNSGVQLYPKDPKQALLVDQILGLVHDNFSAIYNTMGMEEEAKLKKRTELAETTLPQKHKYLESALEGVKKAISGLSLADLAAHAYVKTIRGGFLDNIPTTLLDDSKTIVASFDAVEAALK